MVQMLIDMNKLVKELRELCRWHAENAGEFSILQRAIRIVYEQPTIDAEPVRHGKWITYCKTKDSNLLICSECKVLFNVGMGRIDESHYCPNCGARMDKE